MSSYRQILYHIVYGTKRNEKTLLTEHRKELFAYIMGIIKNKGCHVYRINGMEEHVHLLTDLHPSIALADYIRDIKTSTSLWLKQNKKFPAFKGWAEGYAAFTYSNRDKEMIINYIKNQHEHHKKVTFKEELMNLLVEQGIEIDERYFP